MPTQQERLAALQQRLDLYEEELRCSRDWLERGKWRRAIEQVNAEIATIEQQST